MVQNLLVCAATAFELSVCPELGGVRRVVTGVGIPATFAHLPDALKASPVDLIVNIGIAGAYPNSGMVIGDIVLANGEFYADMGMELPGEPGFLALPDTDFGAFYAEPLATVVPDTFLQMPLEIDHYRIHRAHGATVNACTGTEATGLWREKRYAVGFETMEGAAVAQIGKQFGIPVCEIRAISNIAANRDMRPENIRHALDNLRHFLASCFRTINKK